jgi:ketosteroid isomerase-like protein
VPEDIAELGRRAYDALNRRDLDAFLALADPDVEVVSLIAEAEGAVYHGHDGIREWWEQVVNSLGGIRFKEEAVRATSDKGLLIELVVTGEAGGVEVEQRMWQAVEVRNGLALWWQAFRTEDEALAALAERAA